MKKLKLIAVLMAILMTTNVHAALQSRPGGTPLYDGSANGYFEGFRDMEKEGGPLGLRATFETNSSKSYIETSTSNNIDSHMCKNSEWGAVAMLSASDYGAGNGKVNYSYDSTTKIYNLSASTTGNLTGVFGMYSAMLNLQWVAGGIKSSLVSNYDANSIGNAPVRYVDFYQDGQSDVYNDRFLPGDATYETLSFYGVKNSTFVYGSNYFLFARGRNGIFNFKAHDAYEYSKSSGYKVRFARMFMGRRRFIIWRK